MANKDSCCYGCNKRTFDCHTTCKDYLAEKPKYEYKPKATKVVNDYFANKYSKFAHKKSRRTKR